ncbi:MAG: NAD(P)-dependent oxidoreductase [Capsulimonadales bacterium]|nr:NAD(P)-dependent oxidoreductase [Capsulimonadales bacterium]
MQRLTVLVTGPGGRIGPHLLPTFRERFDVRLLDRQPIPNEPETIIADLSDREILRQAMEGADVLVHLAATSDEAPFLDELVPNNVVGLYNTFEAAREAGVRRIVFASTVQTVAYYPHETTIEVTDPVRPITLYGVTKVLGEVLGRWYYDRHGIEFVGVRIGHFLNYDHPILLDPERSWSRDIWLSPRDAAGILSACIEKPGLTYHLIFATSVSGRERLSRKPLREVLGYEPVDNVRTLFPHLYPDPVADP